MDISEKNKIYDRLLEISMKMESSLIIDPRYINEKIGQCHVFIEEVEKFYIQVSKEISTIQRALNNSEAAYGHARDKLISEDDEIRSLPSVKDREARANSMLHKELMEIKSYQNELADLDAMLKTINLKIKNLTRLNTDIKLQMRLMESQIKLGSNAADQAVSNSLAEELRKSSFGKDIFENAETTVEENLNQDPTSPLNVNDLLQSEEEEPETEENVEESLINPVPADPSDDMFSCMPEEGATGPNQEEAGLVDLDKVLVPESAPQNVEKIVVPAATIESPSSLVILPEPQTGGPTETKTQIPQESDAQKTTPKIKNPDDIDIISLLKQFN